MEQSSFTKLEQSEHSTVCVHCDKNHSHNEQCYASLQAEAAPISQDVLIGQILGDKYRIEELIGAGGMCQVYRATQTLIGKTVALKLLRPQLAVDQQQVRRFEQEATALGRLHHPHALNVFDFGVTSQECPYLVMDFISGRSLYDVIRQESPLSVARTNNLLSQICGALQAAHNEGIIHRDIKPENILISEADGEDWVTVVDFGVAKLQEDINQKSSLTAEGIIIGTPRYMSPEQSEGKLIDIRSDIYSLGVVLYEMLAGEAPFTDNSSTRLLIKHITEDPPPLRDKRPDIPHEIEAVVMRTLAKDPAIRPGTALELSKAFEQATSEVVYENQPARSLTTVIVPLAATAVNNDELQTGQEPVTRLRVVTSSAMPAPVSANTIQKQYWWGKALAVSLLVLGLALAAFYFSRSSEVSQPVEQIIATQRTITLATNQISMLPQGHLLREQLSQLTEWQRELGRYATLANLSPDAQNRIKTMDELAKNYTEQAQLAIAQASPVTSDSVNASGTANGATLDQDAQALKEEQEKTVKSDEGTESAADPSKRKTRPKGPNKFTQVFKKVFRIP